MPTDEERLAEEVSRLYWETDVSVGEIASQLDVSRRALYAALRPLPAGGERCRECGAELAFMTRSARADRAAECPACGLEQEVAVVVAVEAGGGDVGEAGAVPAPAAAAEQAAAAEDGEDYGAALAAALRSPRGVLIAAAALAGVAAGIVGAIRLLRR